MRFFQLQVTRRKPIPINNLRILTGFLTEFLTVDLKDEKMRRISPSS